MIVLWGLLVVLGYLSYVVFGGPLWRRTSLRALRRSTPVAQQRLAAQILPALPEGSFDRKIRTRLDGALEVLAIELERLLPMARDLDAIWWQVCVAAGLSSRGWAQGMLDRFARFQAMALRTLWRAQVEAEQLDTNSRMRLEDELGAWAGVLDRLAVSIADTPGRASRRTEASTPTQALGPATRVGAEALDSSAQVEARSRPRPSALLEALELIGRTRQALRAPESAPYR